jgi:hypothetical protein
LIVTLFCFVAGGGIDVEGFTQLNKGREKKRTHDQAEPRYWMTKLLLGEMEAWFIYPPP